MRKVGLEVALLLAAASLPAIALAPAPQSRRQPRRVIQRARIEASNASEIEAWNAAVEAKKAEKRAHKMAKDPQ